MSKYLHYSLLLMVLIVPTGCQTVKGAATGLGQDAHNAVNPDKNGWNAVKKTDSWIKENLW